MLFNASNTPIDCQVYIYPTPLSQAGCAAWTIFKQSIAGLYSEFSFSKTGCLPKLKDPVCPIFLELDSEVRTDRVINFQRA